MALVIALNAALSFGVTVVVVAPLIWAIVTQDRDVRAVTPQRRRTAPNQTTRPALA
jgi:hypothetical protein